MAPDDVKLLHFKYADAERWAENPISKLDRYRNMAPEIVDVPAAWHWHLAGLGAA